MAATSVPASTSTATLASWTPPYNGTCVTDSDCAVPPGWTCSGGVCTCSIGYDLDETSVTCRKLTECSSFGSDFTLFVNLAIRGHNIRTIHSKTSAECAELCVDAKDIVCRSFEDYYNSCFLQTLTWFDVGGDDHRSLEDVGHYQRRCNW
ncbi:uncharacterized protein LOC124257817 [Haliotis rubra]|uniref:uncharacterized protein LOC124257817 n=1 Tax=Haliotis rubra TaxID=36100 RepID=UPI001EE547AF|nr:uncharacterized protein LOC124257817 [Haliotis rubra]